MSETEYLDLDDLLRLVRRLGAGPVRDPGLLASALARPEASVFGVDAYASPQAKAAAFFHSLVGNVALVEGNKRMAWLATTVFLHLNGYAVDMGDDDAFDLVLRAAGREMGLDDLTDTFEQSVTLHEEV